MSRPWARGDLLGVCPDLERWIRSRAGASCAVLTILPPRASFVHEHCNEHSDNEANRDRPRDKERPDRHGRSEHYQCPFRKGSDAIVARTTLPAKDADT